MTNPSYYLPIWQIAVKELRSFFHSNLAWGILGVYCLIAGLLGYWGMKKEVVSNKAVHFIFGDLFAGLTMTVSVLTSMRLFAEERASGTIELLVTAPISEAQMVAGKFLSAVMFMMVTLAVTLPIPIFIMMYGDAHWGQIVVVYMGLFFLGMAAMAVTTFYSTLTNIQLLAAVMGGANVILFLLLGFFSPFMKQPMKGILREFSFYVHYMDFERGVIVLRHLLFYVSVIVFYLYLSVVALQSRRWK